MFRNRGKTGEMSEVHRSGGEVCVDWTVPRFLDLSDEGMDFYESPPFCFYDACWHLRMWPNWGSYGRVDISLRRGDDVDSSTRNVTVSVGVRGSGGEVDMRREEEQAIGKGCGWSFGDICTRSNLKKQKERLMPGEALTIVCKIKVPGTTVRDASTQTEVEIKEGRGDDKQSSEKRGIEHKVLEDLGKLLDSSQRCDITVQVKETEFKVHSSILCARSPVLSAMLVHDTAERASLRITLDDCEPEVFEEYLRYLYTGSVKSLSHRTVFGLYRLADQYLADDLKLLCLEHIRDTLCVETFCDTVTLALGHRERNLLQRAIDFATQNIRLIVISTEWQNFICEHPREANEIFVRVLGPPS